MAYLTMEEKETFAEKNWRYIHYFAKKYYSPQWDYDELVAVGSLGMTEALNSFDTEKGVKFSTYSARCITNRIFMYMRREKKHQNNISIDQPFAIDETGKELTILDTLSIEEPEFDWREISPVVNKVLDSLSVRDQKILRLFLDNQKQNEIGKELGISQSYVARVIKKILLKIKKEYWRGETKVAAITLEQYKKFKNEGLSDAAIAQKVGIKQPSLLYHKKKWFPDTQQRDTTAQKPPQVDDAREDKAAEYEALIQSLEVQIKNKDSIVEQLQRKIEKYEHLNAACNDVEEEVASLREENQALKKQVEELENAPCTPLQCDCEVKMHRLQEENQALKNLLKLYL